MALSTRARPSFTHSQFLPPGSFYKPLILIQQRANTLKPYSQKTSQSNHTRTTALSNSMELWAMTCRATQDRWVLVESSDQRWSTGEGNGKPLQHSCLENPMNSMKRQKRYVELGLTLKPHFNLVIFWKSQTAAIWDSRAEDFIFQVWGPWLI